MRHISRAEQGVLQHVHRAASQVALFLSLIIHSRAAVSQQNAASADDVLGALLSAEQGTAQFVHRAAPQVALQAPTAAELHSAQERTCLDDGA